MSGPVDMTGVSMSLCSGSSKSQMKQLKQFHPSLSNVKRKA